MGKGRKLKTSTGFRSEELEKVGEGTKQRSERLFGRRKRGYRLKPE